jgi:hypothetical protein
MNWKRLKEEVYFEDGSLRDIYIFDTSIEDWKKWVDLVNREYRVSFYNGQTEQTTDKIDFEVVNAFWTSKTDLVNWATIFINGFDIKCYFFGWEEFENDFRPNEFRSEQDHYQLMSYLVDVSTHLGKKVIVTEESSREYILIEVEKEKIKINGANNI